MRLTGRSLVGESGSVDGGVDDGDSFVDLRVLSRGGEDLSSAVDRGKADGGLDKDGSSRGDVGGSEGVVD